MSKTIQIKNVPEDLYLTLRVRASRAGMTLSDYLLAELSRNAARPTLEELVERLRRRKPNRTHESSAQIIRRHRDAS